MARVEIDANYCKGCGLCFGVCPKNLLRASENVNAKGYNYAEQIDAEKCTACKLCAIICPDAAISVYK
ncbi:MAG: ferredoxin family protein [Eubacteriaceae bacterium]|jgi:2-oxoglutarate ferredoxin oxidoreductase subunit delta|nr:ferredoxin family protein [Eubacteriaceae bacterium]